MKRVVVASWAMLLAAQPGCQRSVVGPAQAASLSGPARGAAVVKSEETWRKQLTPEQFRITRNKESERAFTGAYWNLKDTGVYACICCDQRLFSSTTKFDAGTGWPSFWSPILEDNIKTESDVSAGVRSVEVCCRRCDAHLGNLFEDGPAPTGLRYCINSASLRFAPASLEPGRVSHETEMHTAYFAGGCFWGIEDRFQQVPGVIDAVSGYMGGKTPAPTSKEVSTGRTGHAETVRITFDPKRVRYQDLLAWFSSFTTRHS